MFFDLFVFDLIRLIIFSKTSGNRNRFFQKWWENSSLNEFNSFFNHFFIHFCNHFSKPCFLMIWIVWCFNVFVRHNVYQSNIFTSRFDTSNHFDFFFSIFAMHDADTASKLYSIRHFCMFFRPIIAFLDHAHIYILNRLTLVHKHLE
jgi:hypothetical protein